MQENLSEGEFIDEHFHSNTEYSANEYISSNEESQSNDENYSQLNNISKEENNQKSQRSKIVKILRSLEDLEMRDLHDVVREKMKERRMKLLRLLEEYDGSLSHLLRAEFGDVIRSTQRKIEDNVQKRRGAFRKKITGVENKRVRDMIKEKKQEAPIIRLLDSITFTCGVLNVGVCEFFVLQFPQWFWLWYMLITPLLIAIKIDFYKGLKWLYFTYDFCYFANLCCMAAIMLFPPQSIIHPVSFFFANGPLAMAIPVWRNSLVFHDIDRLSSTYIHIFPALITFCLRWHSNDTLPSLFKNFYEPVEPNTFSNGNYSELSTFFIIYPLILYIIWQLLYLLITEVFDKLYFDADPELQSSLIYLSTHSRSNALAKFVLILMRKVGIFQPKEEYNPTSLKTKLVFVGSQFFYTLACFFIAWIVYQDYWYHVIYLVYLFAQSVYNGACYYIEVFSRRYFEQFKKNS